MRIGIGYDVHQLQDGLPLWIGGIKIPYTRGLVGHSDADVLIHAICDALLGAAALGDIGQHFPDSDNAYKGIDSKLLLSQCCGMIRREGYSIGNVDSIIIAQRPKLAPHIPAMRETLSAVMGISPTCLSVKATTTEHLGFEGREEGISAQAVVMLG
ncbi:MAG: 2-C-methyl-D-erythritol 2,4-cyclodiphosphate synthase [Bacteroidales bacterium]|nr:2-C-methyl-D-erythritol 2,4-cyclodiphosphate synthase [Candidatus Colimorpha onthohippi]